MSTLRIISALMKIQSSSRGQEAMMILEEPCIQFAPDVEVYRVHLTLTTIIFHVLFVLNKVSSMFG